MSTLTKEDRDWIAEKKIAANQFEKIMGYRMPVRDVPEGNNLYSYTSSEPAIYLKKESPLTDGLSDKQKRRIRFGAFMSELLMVQFTDFDYGKELASRLAGAEKLVYLFFANIVEKGASRRFAPSFVGGKFYTAYKGYLVRVCDILPPVNEAKNELQELVYAMMHICYSDTIKGKFKSLNVRKVMKDIYPVLIKTIDCPDPEKRMDKALNIMDMAKSIWEPAVDELGSFTPFSGKKKYMETLFGVLSSSLISGLSGSGSGSLADELDEKDEDVDYSTGAKRESTWEKIDKEDEEDEKEERKEEEEENIKEGKKTKNSLDKETYKYSDEDIDLSTGNDFDAEDEEEALEAEDFFDDLIKRELEIDNVELATTSKSTVPDFREISKRYGEREYKCKNILVTPKDPKQCYDIYNEIVSKDAHNIVQSYKKLDRIFKDEATEEEYRASGKISMKRVASGKVSSKMFTKKVDPDDKRSIALMIAVDQSGSMYSGGRIERAKAAAIDISEVFSKLNIPVYVMGFTADTKGADAVHMHYLQWHTKTKMDRATIACMQADSNNFDGYSIRMASSILARRPEKHKILMVISDGQPACNAYNVDSTGYSDTISAIQDARDLGQSVLGFGIGTDVEILKKFYEDDFVYINVSDDLFKGMMTKITNMVKKW